MLFSFSFTETPSLIFYGNEKSMANPIWKDLALNIGGADYTLYRIKVGGAVIFEGKAYKRPGDTQVMVKINDVCADYLENTLPNLSQASFEAITLPVVFSLEVYVLNQWAFVGDISFYNDWSYDPTFDPETMGLAHPINGKVSAKGWLIYTAYDSSSVSAVLTFKDGTSQTLVIPIAKSNDFNDDFNEDFSRATAMAGSGSATIDLSQWEDLAKVEIGNTTYKVEDTCKRYTLHYLNAYGGWDSLLIEGNVKETDSSSRTTMDVEYNNASLMNRGTRVIANEITKTFTLFTGWMSDAESERMHHLVNSTDIYLEDTLEGRFYPVIMETSTLDHKTYKNNGGMVNYELSVSLAQSRQRR